MHNLIGATGIGLFVGLAFLLSSNRRKIPWRTVIVGIILQVIIALFFLQSDMGKRLFQFLNVGVVRILSHGRSGAEVVFGALAVPPGETGEGGEESMGVFLLFQGFPVIIFVASAMAIFVGGTAALVPERRKDLVRLGPSALLAANLACFQTAALAGLCLSSSAALILQNT